MAVDAGAAGAPAEASLSVQVASLAGELLAEVRVRPEVLGDELRERVEAALKSYGSVEQQQLVVGGKVLDPTCPIADLAAPGGGPLHITVVRSPAPKLAAVCACAGGTLQVWDLERGELLRERVLAAGAGGHDAGGMVACAAADWASRRALTGSSDGWLRLWCLEQLQLLREMGTPGCSLTCLQVDWVPSLALVGSSDGTLRLWDLECGDAVHELRGHTAAVLCVAWAPDLALALSGSQDCTLRLWDLAAGCAVNTLAGHCMPVNCVAADFALGAAVSGSTGCLRTWRGIFQSWPPYTECGLEGNSGAITCCCVDWPSETTVVCSIDGSVRVRCREAWRLVVAPSAGATTTSTSALWMPRSVVAGSSDGRLRLWDLEEVQAACPAMEVRCRGGVDALALLGSELPSGAAARPAPAGHLLLDFGGAAPPQAPVPVVLLGRAGGHARPRVADVRHFIKETHRLLYADRLRFHRPGCAAALLDDERVPVPPRALQVSGPGSVVQMLLLALQPAPAPGPHRHGQQGLRGEAAAAGQGG